MQKTLRIWLISSNYNEEFRIFDKTFQGLRKKLNIEIEFKIVTWGRAYERLIEAFKHKKGPDIFVLGSTWVATFQHLGYLAEVPESFKRRKNLAEWTEECCSFDQKQYSVPWYVEPLVLMGNERLINKYYGTVDGHMNWQQFKHICDRINYNVNECGGSESNLVPFSFLAKPDMMTIHYFNACLYKRGFGYPEIHKHQDRFINLEEFLDTFRYILDLGSHKDLDIPDPSLYSNLQYALFYVKEQCSFIVDSATHITRETLKALNNPGGVCRPFKIYSIPSDSENMPTWAGGGFLNVSASSGFKEEAWTVIDELMGPEFLEEWCAARGYMPAFECELWDKYSGNLFISSLKKEIINSRCYPFHPLWRNIELILLQGITKLLWQYLYTTDKPSYDKIFEIEKDMNEKIGKMLSLTWEMK